MTARQCEAEHAAGRWNNHLLGRYLDSIEDKDSIQPGYDPDKAFDEWWQKCQDYYNKI